MCYIIGEVLFMSHDTDRLCIHPVTCSACPPCSAKVDLCLWCTWWHMCHPPLPTRVEFMQMWKWGCGRTACHTSSVFTGSATQLDSYFVSDGSEVVRQEREASSICTCHLGGVWLHSTRHPCSSLAATQDWLGDMFWDLVSGSEAVSGRV